MHSDQARTAAPPAIPRRGRVCARIWHALLAGGFVVAYLTANEGFFGTCHEVVGIGVLGLLALRLVSTVIPAGGRLGLLRSGRHAWKRNAMAIVLLLGVLAATASGIPVADGPAALVLHARLSTLGMALVSLHATLMVLLIAD